MKKILSALMLVLILGVSCKKKDKTHFSTWTANGEKFTAHANGTVGKVIAIISGSAESARRNSFNIYFNVGWLPTEEMDWIIADGGYFSQNPNYAYMNFYYNDTFYIHLSNRNDVINASLDKDGIKAHYHFTDTWFYNYNDHSDSVLFSGDFYEPYQNINQ